MNFYPFHIGDYRSATAHLSNDEDLAYRRLLDMYYDSESPISLEIKWVSRRLRLNDEIVANVLHDFFIETEKGWIHNRCDIEIEKYHQIALRNRNNGRKGGRPPKNKKPSGFPVGSQRVSSGLPEKPSRIPLETKPLTINQEPLTKTKEKILKKKKSDQIEKPGDVSEEIWNDFISHRKTKKANVTKTALEGILREANKAGWRLEDALSEIIVRGWTGFKADWVQKDRNTHKPSEVTDWGTIDDL